MCIRDREYLHARNIVHRDMKPQNILIGTNGTVKIADFGFARRTSESMVMTSIKGTPLYMAPEVVQEKPYNYTADLWSLGVILFELLVGKPPFYTDNIYTLLRMIVKESVKYPPEIPAGFKGFLEVLLVKKPSNRATWPGLSTHPFITHLPSCLPTADHNPNPNHNPANHDSRAYQPSRRPYPCLLYTSPSPRDS
eukprot:TRINITY_DN49142_c0_g1_i2.p1 TRINITY_DN49142_c0_g1~~TRINITY_DN49142_c0_g1_i2.p1  ORF type:complete len:195 (-),score=57.22 TRINITY_DN49142_c0_g1_i2:125-709(-)